MLFGAFTLTVFSGEDTKLHTEAEGRSKFVYYFHFEHTDRQTILHFRKASSLPGPFKVSTCDYYRNFIPLISMVNMQENKDVEKLDFSIFEIESVKSCSLHSSAPYWEYRTRYTSTFRETANQQAMGSLALALGPCELW